MMKNITYLLCFFLFFITACEFETSEKQHTPKVIDASKEIFNWTCMPGEKVGLITKDFTEADIIKVYGQENVSRAEIGLGEGEMTTATVLFPKTVNELFITWTPEKKFQEIAEIKIENKEGPWTTSQGIGIGTTIEELIKKNGKNFNFAGFEWDYSGYTNDWQGGNISKSLVVFLEPTNPEAVYPDLLGDNVFNSNHPKAKAAGLKVRTMVIRF